MNGDSVVRPFFAVVDVAKPLRKRLKMHIRLKKAVDRNCSPVGDFSHSEYIHRSNIRPAVWPVELFDLERGRRVVAGSALDIVMDVWKHGRKVDVVLIGAHVQANVHLVRH
jgi:hypothetical protein